MASSTTKPVAMVSAISERLSSAEAAQVHHAERADQRHRHRDAGNQRRAHVAQEQEHDQDHQPDRDDAACARPRAATRGSWACGRCTTSGRWRRESTREAAAAALRTRSTVSMMLAPGWRLRIEQHGRLAVGRAGVAHVLHRVDHLAPRRRAAPARRCDRRRSAARIRAALRAWSLAPICQRAVAVLDHALRPVGVGGGDARCARLRSRCRTCSAPSD